MLWKCVTDAKNPCCWYKKKHRSIRKWWFIHLILRLGLVSECRIRKIQLRIPLFLKSRIFDTKQKKWLLILKVASKISNKLKVIVSIISITPLLSSEEMTTSCGWHRFYHCSRCWMYWDILHMQKAALGHITVSHWDISLILVRLRGRERASGSWLNWGSHTFTTMIGQFTELESRLNLDSI